MNFKAGLFLILLLLSHQSFASVKAVCSGVVGNPGEEKPVEIRISSYITVHHEEFYKAVVSFYNSETTHPLNIIKHRDNSGYSLYIPRVLALDSYTLFSPNEIYLYTNGAQSSLNYEWKYIGGGKCTPGYRLIPTLCEAVYAEDGGSKKANLTCQIYQ